MVKYQPSLNNPEKDGTSYYIHVTRSFTGDGHNMENTWIAVWSDRSKIKMLASEMRSISEIDMPREMSLELAVTEK